MDYVLLVLGALCCLALPTLLLGAPLAALGVSQVRKRPERRGVFAVAVATANAMLSGLVFGVTGLVMGMGVESEDAGVVLEFLLGTGLCGGALLGFALTLLVVTMATRPRTSPSAPGAVEGGVDVGLHRERALRRGRRWLVVSAALLVVGVATSLVSFIFSLSLGLISLGLAVITVRPLALAFVTLHSLVALLAGRHAVRAPRDARSTLTAATVIAIAGVLAASTIAVFGPSFFESLLDRAADVLTAPR